MPGDKTEEGSSEAPSLYIWPHHRINTSTITLINILRVMKLELFLDVSSDYKEKCYMGSLDTSHMEIN